MNSLSSSPLLTFVSLFAILVGIIAIISSAIGIQHFQRLASQNDPIAIGMILAIVVVVLAIAYKLGWAQSWIAAKS